MTDPHADSISTPAFWIAQWEELNASRTAYGGYGSPATWNAMAAGYGRRSDGDDRDREDRVGATLSFLDARGVSLEGARVLDIGCGPGTYAAAFLNELKKNLEDFSG